MNQNHETKSSNPSEVVNSEKTPSKFKSNGTIEESQEPDVRVFSSRKKSASSQFQKGLLDFMGEAKRDSTLKIEIHEHAKKKSNNVTIISICGGAASGKTFIVKSLKNHLKNGKLQTTYLKERNFMRRIPVADDLITEEILANYDFDHYNAIDWNEFEQAVKKLSNDESYDCPIYDIIESKPITKTKNLKPSNVILIEGRLFLNNDFIRKSSDFIIYLDTDCDIILSRLIVKQQTIKHKKLEEIVRKYTEFIKPNYEKFVVPTKQYADMIIYNFAGQSYTDEEQQLNFPFLNMVKDWLNNRMKQVIE